MTEKEITKLKSYKWFDKFITNWKVERGYDNEDKLPIWLEDNEKLFFLPRAFIWDCTPEGYEYWQNIYKFIILKG